MDGTERVTHTLDDQLGHCITHKYLMLLLLVTLSCYTFSCYALVASAFYTLSLSLHHISLYSISRHTRVTADDDRGIRRKISYLQYSVHHINQRRDLIFFLPSARTSGWDAHVITSTTLAERSSTCRQKVVSRRRRGAAPLPCVYLWPHNSKRCVRSRCHVEQVDRQVTQREVIVRMPRGEMAR